jgi:hypothetical protein
LVFTDIRHGVVASEWLLELLPLCAENRDNVAGIGAMISRLIPPMNTVEPSILIAMGG